jgi:hypothetical protein
MDITHENYHSLPVKQAHYSNSQFKQWLSCGAATKAMLAGAYVQETTDAMLVGSFVDAALTTPHLFGKWKEDHAEQISLKKGGLKAPFEMGITMIDRVMKDQAFKQITTQAKGQVVLHGTIAGKPWLYLADWIMDTKTGPVLLDLKTTANFESQWAVCFGKNVKIEWYDAWGYFRQLSIGRELYHQMHGVYPQCGIVAVTKQDPPALGVWVMEDTDRMEGEIRRIEELMETVDSWKSGEVEPPACGTCAYCRAQSSFGVERLAVSARPYTE